MTLRDIERVLYFEAYVVTDAGMVTDPDIQRCKLLTEEQYLTTVEEHGDEFSAAMGAEGIRELLRNLDVDTKSSTCGRSWRAPPRIPRSRNSPSA